MQKTDKYINISIVDNKTLLTACDYLHDASFDITNLEVNIKKGIWRGIFEREYFEDEGLIKTEPKLFLIKKYTYPLIRTELVLEGITHYSINDRSDIGCYGFNECQIKKNEYQLIFCEAMEMSIKFTDQPRGKCIDLGLTGKTRSVYSLGRLMPFSTY